MKTCPQCNRKYDDETLNFCLEDGSVLNRADSLSDEPPPTVVMESPVPTTPNQSFGAPTAPQTEQTQQTWGNQSRYQPQVSSGSKSWLWVLGILGGIVILCGGGFVGLIAIGSFVEDEDPPPLVANKEADEPGTNEKAPKDSRLLKKTADLSKWKVDGNEYVTSDIEDGELVLTSGEAYYYVILTKDFKTYDATVKWTLSNKEGGAAPLGYGLVIHSDPLNVLDKDYAFLIRTDTQQYRIVRHSKKRERNIVNWTRSTAIKKGSRENDLEVRVNGREMNFYINGVFVRKERDFSTYQDGVAGIYTSGDIPIGFSKIEYRK